MNLPAMEDGFLQHSVGRVAIEVGRLAWRDGKFCFEPEHARWIVSSEPRNARNIDTREASKISDSAVHRKNGTGKNTIGEAATIGNFDLKTAECIDTFRHAGCGHPIGNEDATIHTLRFQKEAHDLGCNMDAVANEFREEGVVIKHDAKYAGLAMVERTHRIKRVRCRGSASGDGGACFHGECIGVTDTDPDALGDSVTDQVDCTWVLRGNRDEANVATSGLLKAIEESDIRHQDMGWGMDTALGVRDEGAFKMNAKRNCSIVVRRFDSVGNMLEPT